MVELRVVDDEHCSGYRRSTARHQFSLMNPDRRATILTASGCLGHLDSSVNMQLDRMAIDGPPGPVTAISTFRASRISVGIHPESVELADPESRSTRWPGGGFSESGRTSRGGRPGGFAAEPASQVVGQRLA